jgi:hypothetical protein
MPSLVFLLESSLELTPGSQWPNGIKANWLYACFFTGSVRDPGSDCVVQSSPRVKGLPQLLVTVIVHVLEFHEYLA